VASGQKRRDRRRQAAAGCCLRDLKKAYALRLCLITRVHMTRIQRSPTNPNEGNHSISPTYRQGQTVYTLRRLEFTGNTFTRDKVMRREFLLKTRAIFLTRTIGISRSARLNQTQYFDRRSIRNQTLDPPPNEEKGDVELSVRARKRPPARSPSRGVVRYWRYGSFGASIVGTNNLPAAARA